MEALLIIKCPHIEGMRKQKRRQHFDVLRSRWKERSVSTLPSLSLTVRTPQDTVVSRITRRFSTHRETVGSYPRSQLKRIPVTRDRLAQDKMHLSLSLQLLGLNLMPLLCVYVLRFRFSHPSMWRKHPGCTTGKDNLYSYSKLLFNLLNWSKWPFVF